LEQLMTSNGVTTSFTYDAWGRMASKNATIGGTARTAYYSYSYGDKLKHVWTNFPGETTTAYNYDGLGKRRVRITDYNGVNPQTTWWRWDLGWSPLCEYADPNLGWEIEGFAQFNVYNGLMHPLAEAAVSGSPANAAYSYLALDHLSSTRAVYNQAKTATASLEFYPYGETFAATGALPDARFTAQHYDEEVDLFYFSMRYYNPDHGRWITCEPSGIDGPNMYHYVFGNPIMFVDFRGEFAILPIFGAIAGGAVGGAIIGSINAIAVGDDIISGAIGGAIQGAVTTAGVLVGGPLGGALGGGIGGAINNTIIGKPPVDGFLCGSISGLVSGCVSDIKPIMELTGWEPPLMGLNFGLYSNLGNSFCEALRGK
jgi:RHS repeat-associated protein